MRKNLCLLLLPVLLSGCASLVRPLTDATLGAGGAWLGHQLSGGDPLATAGGAAAGVLAGEGLHALKNRSEQKAYVNGYQKGRSDGVKQNYWNLQAEQQNAPGLPKNFEVQVPAHREGEVLFNETKQVIRN